jgi:hypothetical protein
MMSKSNVPFLHMHAHDTRCIQTYVNVFFSKIWPINVLWTDIQMCVFLWICSYKLCFDVNVLSNLWRLKMCFKCTSIKINYTHLDAHLSHLNVPCVKRKINASLTPWYGSLPLTPFEIIKGGGGEGGDHNLLLKFHFLAPCFLP